MATAPSLGDRISKIANSGPAVISGIAELAGAEIKPAAKHIGIGGGLFGAALTVVYGGLKYLGVAVAMIIAYFFYAVASLSTIMALFLGFLVTGFLWFAVGVVFALLGKGQFSRVKGPEQTMAEISASMSTLGEAVNAGSQAAGVASAELPPAPTTPAPLMHLATDSASLR